MAKKDNSALAWMVGLGTLAVAGIGVYFYEKSQPAAPTTSPPALPPVGVTAAAPAAAACAQAQKLVALRRANPNQAPGILQKPYSYWAAQCTAAGGTPPAWPG